jgi:hypothetical protein
VFIAFQSENDGGAVSAWGEKEEERRDEEEERLRFLLFFSLYLCGCVLSWR